MIFQPLLFYFAFPQNKRRKDDLSHLAFLLSFDLRDYPLNGWDLSPSVTNHSTKAQGLP
jgi:hypothetical protein